MFFVFDGVGIVWPCATIASNGQTRDASMIGPEQYMTIE